jgi:hypothetical protein
MGKVEGRIDSDWVVMHGNLRLCFSSPPLRQSLTARRIPPPVSNAVYSSTLMTRSPFTEINFSNQDPRSATRGVLPPALIGWKRLGGKFDLSVLDGLEQLGREFSDPRQSLS